MSRLACISAVLVCVAVAQDWVARYSTGQYQHDDARALVVDGQGNSYVVGYAQGIGVLEYSPNGETLWTRRYTRTGFTNFGGMATALTPSGKLMVVASIRKDTLNGFCLLRYEPTGALIWDTVFWHSRSNAPVWEFSSTFLAVGQLGAIYVAGSAASDSTGDDIVTCKFNLDGGLVWARYKDGQHHRADNAGGIVLDGEENVFVATDLVDASDITNAGAVRYDSAGRLVWSYSYMPNTGYWSVTKSLSRSGSGICFAGYRQNPGSPGYYSLVVKLNSGGDTAWTRVDSTRAYAVVADSTGNCYVCGYVVQSWRWAMRTWKYNPSGQLLWCQDYGVTDSATTSGMMVVLTSDLGVCAAGKRNAGSGRFDFVVSRYTPEGQLLWSTFSDTADPNVSTPASAAVDRWDNVVMTGKYHYLQIGQDDFVTMKFRASGAIEEPSAVPPTAASAVEVTPSVVHNGCRISVPGSVRGVSIADAAGRRVRTLTCPTRSQGSRAVVTWDACDEHGQRVADGVYFVTLESSGVRSSAKVIVTR